MGNSLALFAPHVWDFQISSDIRPCPPGRPAAATEPTHDFQRSAQSCLPDQEPLQKNRVCWVRVRAQVFVLPPCMFRIWHPKPQRRLRSQPKDASKTWPGAPRSTCKEEHPVSCLLTESPSESDRRIEKIWSHDPMFFRDMETPGRRLCTLSHDLERRSGCLVLSPFETSQQVLPRNEAPKGDGREGMTVYQIFRATLFWASCEHLQFGALWWWGFVVSGFKPRKPQFISKHEKGTSCLQSASTHRFFHGTSVVFVGTFSMIPT